MRHVERRMQSIAFALEGRGLRAISSPAHFPNLALDLSRGFALKCVKDFRSRGTAPLLLCPRDATKPFCAQKSTYIAFKGCAKARRTLYKSKSAHPNFPECYISRFSCTRPPLFVTDGVGRLATFLLLLAEDKPSTRPTGFTWRYFVLQDFYYEFCRAVISIFARGVVVVPHRIRPVG